MPDDFFTPTGIVLAYAYKGASIDETIGAVIRHGYPEWRARKAITRLMRQGNIVVDNNIVRIADVAHPSAYKIGERVARRLGIA